MCLQRLCHACALSRCSFARHPGMTSAWFVCRAQLVQHVELADILAALCPNLHSDLGLRKPE